LLARSTRRSSGRTVRCGTIGSSWNIRVLVSERLEPTPP
jgi:hypothetical protein